MKRFLKGSWGPLLLDKAPLCENRPEQQITYNRMGNFDLFPPFVGNCVASASGNVWPRQATEISSLWNSLHWNFWSCFGVFCPFSPACICNFVRNSLTTISKISRRRTLYGSPSFWLSCVFVGSDSMTSARGRWLMWAHRHLIQRNTQSCDPRDPLQSGWEKGFCFWKRGLSRKSIL